MKDPLSTIHAHTIFRHFLRLSGCGPLVRQPLAATVSTRTTTQRSKAMKKVAVILGMCLIGFVSQATPPPDFETAMAQGAGLSFVNATDCMA